MSGEPCAAFVGEELRRAIEEEAGPYELAYGTERWEAWLSGLQDDTRGLVETWLNTRVAGDYLRNTMPLESIDAFSFRWLDLEDVAQNAWFVRQPERFMSCARGPSGNVLSIEACNGMCWKLSDFLLEDDDRIVQEHFVMLPRGSTGFLIDGALPPDVWTAKDEFDLTRQCWEEVE